MKINLSTTAILEALQKATYVLLEINLGVLTPTAIRRKYYKCSICVEVLKATRLTRDYHCCICNICPLGKRLCGKYVRAKTLPELREVVVKIQHKLNKLKERKIKELKKIYKKEK